MDLYTFYSRRKGDRNAAWIDLYSRNLFEVFRKDFKNLYTKITYNKFFQECLSFSQNSFERKSNIFNVLCVFIEYDYVFHKVFQE